ncbi:MAG: hypothetical protein RL375_1168, partial [Pseudomonadota bacterium]
MSPADLPTSLPATPDPAQPGGTAHTSAQAAGAPVVRPKLLLVDGSSYLYRAYHAMPDLRNAQGEPTGAIYGIVTMLERLRADIGAVHAACIFDAKGPTFRDVWYPQYKAQRAPMPDDLRAQIEPIHEVVRLLGWPVLEVPGIEADDAIGTLARVGADSGHAVVISTGDKDMAQLVTPHVTLVNTMSNEWLDEAGVAAKFGVPPNRIIDYLTLIGDTVDNVPGVDKVGPKTAVKWLAEHDSLAGVVAAADSIKGVAGENLRKALDWLPMGRQLITIKLDCDLGAHLPDWPGEAALAALALKPIDKAGLLEFYIRKGFKSWRKKLEDELAAAAPVPASQGGVMSSATGDLFGDAPAQPAATAAQPAATAGATAATGAASAIASASGLPATGLAHDYQTIT